MILRGDFSVSTCEFEFEKKWKKYEKGHNKFADYQSFRAGFDSHT